MLELSYPRDRMHVRPPRRSYFPDDPAALTLARALLAGLMLLVLTGWAVPAPRFRPRSFADATVTSAGIDEKDD